MGQTRLTTIAGTLFRGLRGGSYMFDRTFSDCNKLTDIPYDLFSTISLGSEGMFSYTFSGCKKLAEIPFNLFKAFSLDGATRMFSHTFSDCTGLNFIPNLFTDIASGADYLFESTFGGCSGLADIPSGLFGTRITAGAEGMFDGTFNNCTSLINLPENLFKYITTAATNLFQDTFNHATNLSGYIPKTTFAGLISAGHPTATGMWRRTFHQTNIATTCPTGTSQYITGYESDWNNMVSCQ